MSNGFLVVSCSALSGRISQIEYKGLNFLYHNPQAHYFGKDSGNFALKKGIAVFGGNFMTFPAPEHGLYYDKPFDIRHGTETGAVWVEFSKQDNGQHDQREPKFAKYESTGGTYSMRVTLREILFPMTEVSSGDVDGFRARVEKKIKAAN